ncbi:MAG: hypothetical protein A3A90_00095 [Candidatus Zambryskibacteria bacterium RIFCSPLOWO2_01_FULL_35_19]|uniref:Uncharacterized protein n=1 Tax=Candidatus Zambryskibacteria bacterium RIFCSPLOWO2_01_FULL_35_19 TaxID=1802757 RepID=A0A1G2TVB6_9BACT|nr:MAG: hypothetical protein A2726_00585 [Candidatus Zambryskibacteria bacterium RIFCSPHIGHO2_01_FULL_35_32]OHB01237.1 MAG: hypothetical protein A3A90_00095 [Candidatus Zambryskibacteria bacterium RIFCSPLOWO2_01_FULL_35_19]
MFEYPEFTQDLAESILHDYVGIICLTPMLPQGGVAKCKVDDFAFYIIYLRRIIPQAVGTDDFYETFVHELIHIFHIVQDLPVNEAVVETESVRFYNLNKDFVRKLYKSAVSKILVWDPPIRSKLTSEDRLKLIKQMAVNNQRRN